MTKQLKAGIFDSGAGGLSVVKSLLEANFFDEIIYYGDTARVPYGIKDKNTIIRYSLEALEFFKNFNIDILITACNTVSAYAIEELKKQAPFDVVGVIEPGVLAVTEKIKNKNAHILVTGTNATIKSKKYTKLLQEKDYNNISEKATGLFVSLVEEQIFGGKIMDATMEYYFNNIKKPDALIMGCTHFPLIKNEYQKFFKDTVLIHSGEAIVQYLKENFNLTGKYQKTNIKYFATENPEHLKEIAKQWLFDDSKILQENKCQKF